ncbi:MAG: hypothetical protein CMJ18_00400 [Phycisphaeraceae bacterium]|nr:hypothetical protein [Phycisphaeraceae bacterium]
MIISQAHVSALLILSLVSMSAAKDMPRFDVTQYGAKADGTTDCTPAIREAVEAATRAGGGVIRFPPAEAPYLISDSIELRADNLHVRGEGATVFLKDGSAVGRTSADKLLHIVRIYGTADDPAQNVSVAGLTIDANYWGQTNAEAAWQASAKIAGTTRGVYVEHARNVLIDQVEIRRSFVGMTFGLGAHDCEARDVRVTEFHHDGFGVTPKRVDRGASGITFLRCVAADAPHGKHGGHPGTRVKGWEIEEGAQDVKVIDCAVRDTGAHGFFVRPHWSRKHRFETKNIQLIRCRVENAGVYAFMVKGFNHQQRVANVKLIDCHTDTGNIQIMMGPENVLVSGGHYGSMTIGFYTHVADDHHVPDGPWAWTYGFLPVRSVFVANAHVSGDLRINAVAGHDAADDYISDIILHDITVGGDLYIVGTASLVREIDGTVQGARHVISSEDYLEKFIRPARSN